MSDSAGFALHRSELDAPLKRGEAKITALMSASAQRVSAGTTLVEANSEHNFVYRLKQGWAGRVRELPDGRAQFILVFLPGDLFAVKSMFVARHPDAVRTLSDCVLERIDYRALRDAYAADPDISLRCTWQVVEEERRLHSWVTGLGAGSAEERLALLLCDFRGRLAISTKARTPLRSFAMPLTHEQLADHLGISTVHVSRVVKRFRERNIASVRGRKVEIHNPKALARLAAPLLDPYEKSRPEYIADGQASAIVQRR